MDKEVFGYIYKIRNTVNEKVYIGLTTRGFDRRYDAKGEGIERVYGYHTRRRKNEECYNEHLLNSIEKYGFEAFEVIKEFDVAYSEEELKEKERYWISHYKCNDANYGYNRTEGGDGVVGLKGEDSPRYKGFLVVYPNGEISEEMTRDKVVDYLGVSERIIGDLAREKTCYIGKYEHIKYIRVLHLENYLKEREIYKSDEDFRNMCKHMVEEAEILYKNKKKEFSEAYKGENNPFYGKCPSEEARRKNSEAHKGKKATEETRKKQSEARKGIKNGRAKLIICVFPSGKIIKDICIKELAKELGVYEELVRKILNSHEPYKPTIKRLKHLEGIIIMSQEDYLKENTNQNINKIDNKAS